jgi:PAS domain S-box-containing protein
MKRGGLSMEEQMEKSLQNLVEIIHFTERVSTQIHGVLDEDEIFSIIKKECVHAGYTVSVLLLTDDKSSLKIAETSIPLDKVEMAEKASGLTLHQFTIDLEKSPLYSEVVKGETVHVSVDDILYELAPQSQARALSRILGYRKKFCILTPLKRNEEIIGVLAISSPEFSEYFLPSVKNLAQHISATLELSKKYNECKKAEKLLQESEENLRVLFENQGIGMVMGELDMRSPGKVRPVKFNAAALKFFGYQKGEFSTKTMADVSHPEEFKEDIILLNEVLAKNRYSFEREKRFIRKDGRIVWGYVTVSLLQDAAGTPTHVVASVQDITEQKASEEALRKREEEFRLAFENAKDAIIWVDPETGVIIQCNKAAESILKRDRKDIIGHYQRVLYPPEGADYYSALFNQYREGDYNDIEAEVITTAGERVPVLISGSVTMVGGRPLFQGIFRDITESNRAEELLRMSEEKFRNIAERNFDAIFELDPQGYIAYMSPAIKRITGYEPEEMVGKSILEFVPEAKSLYAQQKHAVLAGGNIVEGFQLEVIKKDGSLTSLEINGSPILKNGKVIGSQGVAREITERKKAEKALRKSEEKYRMLVEQSLQGILIVQGTPPRFVFANSVIAQMSQYTVEELLSLSPDKIRTIIHEKDQIIFERYMARLAGEPTLSRYELRIIRRDGEIRWMELHASRIEYQGNPAVQVALMDITERKKAEEQIKQSLKEKEILLREIHHRVKNNLQVVSSLLNLQAEHAGDVHYVDMLKESQNRIRAMALIHEKLYKSKNVADIDLNEYITALVTKLVRSYQVNPNITVTVTASDVSFGMDTAIPCGLIINELVSNSLKHAFPDGRGDITVELYARKGAIELTVKDNGCGIPDTIDFKNTETLGLDLVCILAQEQLDGDITLDRTNGTAFTITFREVVS